MVDHVEDVDKRITRMRAIAGAATLLEKEHAGSVEAAAKIAADDCIAMTEGLTPDNLFPTKPDKTKS
jgi:hypothetical protein